MTGKTNAQLINETLYELKILSGKIQVDPKTCPHEEIYRVSGRHWTLRFCPRCEKEFEDDRNETP